jgi:hypothetical protein
MKNCPICLMYPVSPRHIDDVWYIECPRCGHYQVTGSAVAITKDAKLSERQRANISGWLFENPGFEISTTNFDRLKDTRSLSFDLRSDKLLLNLEKKTEYAGQYLELDPSWFGSSWSVNVEELREIVDYLVVMGRIKKLSPQKASYKISHDGWRHLEILKETNPRSNQCFVAIWFDEKMKQMYDESFTKAIQEAGYRPHRVDQREYNDKIDDEIIAEIRRSRFIVADFTGQRGGVYYEAGFAKGLGLGVIFTCKKDEIDKLHFDIRQYNCIDWEEDRLTDFVKRLKNRIESVFGHGSYQA